MSQFDQVMVAEAGLLPSRGTCRFGLCPRPRYTPKTSRECNSEPQPTFTVAAFPKEGVVVRLFWCIDLSRTAEIRFYTCLQLRDSRLPLASKARQREVLRAQYRYSRFVNKLYAFCQSGARALFFHSAELPNEAFNASQALGASASCGGMQLFLIWVKGWK